MQEKLYEKKYEGFYVNPDIIAKDNIVCSIGFGQDISFDEEIIERHNSVVYAFDPTPKSIECISNQLPPKNSGFTR